MTRYAPVSLRVVTRKITYCNRVCFAQILKFRFRKWTRMDERDEMTIHVDQYHQKWIAFSPRRDVGGTVVVNQTDDVFAQLHHHRLQLLFLEGHPVVSFLALGPADPVLFVDPAAFRGRAAATAAVAAAAVVVAGHVPGGTHSV